MKSVCVETSEILAHKYISKSRGIVLHSRAIIKTVVTILIYCANRVKPFLCLPEEQSPVSVLE